MKSFTPEEVAIILDNISSQKCVDCDHVCEKCPIGSKSCMALHHIQRDRRIERMENKK